MTLLLLLIILGLLASLGSAVAQIEDTNLLRDGIAATFDEGRMHAMLTAGAAFATKARNINWELDPDRDRELLVMMGQMTEPGTNRPCLGGDANTLTAYRAQMG